MKKRIISLFLAFAVLIGVFSVPKRAHAAGAALATAGVSIGLMVWQLFDIMIKGEQPWIVEAATVFIESGIDGLTNPDSHFQQTYGYLWKDWGGAFDAVYNKALEMYENGEITISNGKIDLTYDQYKNFFDLTYNTLPNIGIEFSTLYEYTAYSYTPGVYLSIADLPTSDYLYSSNGQSYALIYYNSSKVYFSDIALLKGVVPNSPNFRVQAIRYSSSFDPSGLNFMFYNYSNNDLKSSECEFAYASLSTFFGKYIDFGYLYERNFSSEYCFVFENGQISYQSISTADLGGYKTAIISTTGAYGDFLQSINSVTTSESLVDNLDDLSTVLPVEESPVLSIPISPDLSVPIPDQVTVSVPGVNDLPLSEYMDPLITDIEAPTGLATKFPFCIPFDFIRIISVLAADPIPPVFHIPISTHPVNLEGFADNETIGEFVSPDDPMFDINEEIVIDFAHIPLVQPVSYTIFLVGFVIMLIKLTPNLIQH